MRVLHVIPDLAESNGGPPHALATLARAQAAAGLHVTVLPCRFMPGVPTLPPGRTENLYVSEPATHGRMLWYDAALKRRLRELVQAADLVHIHGTWRYHLLGAAAVSRAAGRPFVVRPYGNLGLVNRSQKSFLKRPYFALIERPVINRAAAIHCCSRKEEAELKGLALRARTFVVPLAVEFDLQQVAPDDAGLYALCPVLADPRLKFVVFLGRIARIKQLDRLVAAFAGLTPDHPDWRLVLAGGATETQTLHNLGAQIQQLGIGDRVLLPGVVRDGVKAALLRRVDVFAQPSSHENFGVSLAEACLFGKPSVVSDGVAIAAELATAGAGVMVPPEVDSLRAALRTLMNDAALRGRCGAAARKMVQQFTPTAVAAQLQLEYERCLSP